MLVLTKWLRLEVEVYSAGQGIGDDKRRGGKIIGTGVRVNTTFEVTVAGKDSTSNKVIFHNTILDCVRDLT